MVQSVGNGTFFVVHLNTDLEFSLGLYNREVAIPVGSTATGRILVDQAPPVAVSGRATSSDTVMFTSPQAGLLRSLFERGKVMRLETGESWAQIGLQGSGAAVTRLEKCARNADRASTQPSEGRNSIQIPADAAKTLALSKLSPAEKRVTLFSYSCDSHESPEECMADQFRLDITCDSMSYSGVSGDVVGKMLRNSEPYFHDEGAAQLGSLTLRVGERSTEGGLTSISAEINGYSGTWDITAASGYDSFVRKALDALSNLNLNATVDILGNQAIIVNSMQNVRNIRILAESCSS
jgi:hypothetical protein